MRDDPVSDAAQAHTTLCLFGAIRDLAESSDIHHGHHETEIIRRACGRAMDKALKAYDAACERANK